MKNTTSQDKHRWDQIKEIIQERAETWIGFQTNERYATIKDYQVEEMSKMQKDIRLKIERSKDVHNIIEMKTERNQILREMRKRMKAVKETQIEETIKEIETVKDNARMFKAVKNLRKDQQGIKFVHDKDGKNINQPQEIYKEIEAHFKTHFRKDNINEISKFNTPPKKLRKEITMDEVKKAISTMANNKAPGKDGLPVELIKYAPGQIHKEISEILNNIFRYNDENVKMGTGILLPLPKPGKTKGPVKNLRPITLLEVIRKILSKILMNRIDDKIDAYLSKNQSAYRKGRSTTDIVWAHRWLSAKAQEQDIIIYITGIDMSSAFDTINREELLNITAGFIDEDEMRILRLLLSDTTLEVKVKGAEASQFTSNIGSPQGDSISGPLFTVYFENALKDLRQAIDEEPIDVKEINMQWIEQSSSEMPHEMEYADDCDLITENERKKEMILSKTRDILTKNNLLVNEDKTEHTVVTRSSKREEETWRRVKKLGSLLGEKEDIQRRKILATSAMNSNMDIWKRKTLTTLKTRLKLYETLVLSILLYNSGTWGMNLSDEKYINSFHRRQLRKVIGVQWPHRIRNRKLYEKCNTQPLSITITERRWKLLGHIMRLPANCPARKAMRYFFEVRTNKLSRKEENNNSYYHQQRHKKN